MSYTGVYSYFIQNNDQRLYSLPPEPELGYLVGFHKEYSGLYLYGPNATLSPDNTTDDFVNRYPVGFNPDSVLGEHPPHWVGFLYYRTNDEVHFNNYAGGNNGSRTTILSPTLVRTNKHFIDYALGIPNAFDPAGFCVVYLDDKVDPPVVRDIRARGALVFGNHDSIPYILGYTPANIDQKIWYVTKPDGQWVVEDVTASFRVRLGFESDAQMMEAIAKDDIFFIPETNIQSDINYPYLLTEDALEELDSNDIENYLTVHTIDQNNYIRITSKSPVDITHIHKNLESLTRNNFSYFFSSRIRDSQYLTNNNSIVENFKKFVSLYGATNANVGDSSSCHFIREKELENIDIFLGGTLLRWPEIYTTIRKLPSNPETAVNLIKNMYQWFNDNVSGFITPNIIDVDDSKITILKNIIDQRKKSEKPAPAYLTNNWFNKDTTTISQSLTANIDGDIVLSSLYSSNKFPLAKILNISYEEEKQLKTTIASNYYSFLSYPESKVSGIQNKKLTNSLRSIELVNKNHFYKVNTNNIFFQIGASDIFDTIMSLLQNNISFFENSFFTNILNKNSNLSNSFLLEFEFYKKSNNIIEEFKDFKLINSYNVFFSDVNIIYFNAFSSIGINPGSLISNLNYFIFNTNYENYSDFQSYYLNKSKINFAVKSGVTSPLGFYITTKNLKQNDSIIIKLKNPFNSDEYLTTELLKVNKNYTLDLSSFSTKENDLTYFKAVNNQNTITIEIEVPPTECVNYGQYGDLNSDGKVNGTDLAILLGAYNQESEYDINGDGVVTGADLTVLLNNWGELQDVLADTDPTDCSNIIYTFEVVGRDLVPEESTINTNDTYTLPDRYTFYRKQKYSTDIILE